MPRPRRRRLDDVIDPKPDGWVEWNTDEETQRLLDMMTDSNRLKIHKAQASGERCVGTLYKRMREGVQRAEVRFDGVSGCLRTPDGGSSRQTIVEISHGGVRTRLISPRECARLMGAPDAFRLPGKYNDAYRAMGDGVAVPVAAWLAKNLLAPLAELSREQQQVGTAEFRARPAEDLRRRSESRAKQWEKQKQCVSNPS